METQAEAGFRLVPGWTCCRCALLQSRGSGPGPTWSAACRGGLTTRSRGACLRRIASETVRTMVFKPKLLVSRQMQSQIFASESRHDPSLESTEHACPRVRTGFAMPRSIDPLIAIDWTALEPACGTVRVRRGSTWFASQVQVGLLTASAFSVGSANSGR